MFNYHKWYAVDNRCEHLNLDMTLKGLLNENDLLFHFL